MEPTKYQIIQSVRLQGVCDNFFPSDDNDVVQSEWIIDYTGTGILKEIQINDNTVEIIGCAESVGVLENTGVGQLTFKCILKNAEGQRVKFLAFDDNAKRLHPFFLQNYVMHIDSAVARKMTNAEEEGEGALPFELQAQSNTIVNCLGSPDNIWFKD